MMKKGHPAADCGNLRRAAADRIQSEYESVYTARSSAPQTPCRNLRRVVTDRDKTREGDSHSGEMPV